MIIRMPQPWRHPVSGIWYYRGRIPRDIRPIVQGQMLSVAVDGDLTCIRLNSIIKISLRTKDESEARVRHADASSQIEKRWALARQTSPCDLTQREILTYSGKWYRELLAEHEEDPGDPNGWFEYQQPFIEALSCFDEPEDGEPPRGPFVPAEGFRKLEKLLDIDEFLARQNLSVDRPSREKLLHRIALALVQAANTLQRRAAGDYGPDNILAQFPDEEQPANIQLPSNQITLIDLFEGWAAESAPSASTIAQWKKYVELFSTFVGHQDASKIAKSDVVKWKQHLLEIGNAPKTINGSKLAALGAIYSWGIANERIKFDPTNGVTVRRGKKAGECMLGFDRAEAAVILEAARTNSDSAVRWIPFLCAQSGARVGEICQLRANDIGHEEGVWFMHLRPDAGSVKTASSERRVPIHPHLLETGFLDFVKQKEKGPLFFDINARRPGAKKPQSKIVAKKIGRWVHTLGLEVGLKRRKAPNHAWRHTFRTLARDAEILDSVIDAIEGHASPSEGKKYGSTSLKTMYDAILKLSIPGFPPLLLR